MQNDIPTYETQQQAQEHPHPDYAEPKLGSARPDNDRFDAVSGTGPAGVPTELIAAERRPVDVVPAEALPIETQPTDFMTLEGRPRDVRPREFIPTEGR